MAADRWHGYQDYDPCSEEAPNRSTRQSHRIKQTGRLRETFSISHQTHRARQHQFPCTRSNHGNWRISIIPPGLSLKAVCPTALLDPVDDGKILWELEGRGRTIPCHNPSHCALRTSLPNHIFHTVIVRRLRPPNRTISHAPTLHTFAAPTIA
jgi:hypothetical protein